MSTITATPADPMAQPPRMDTHPGRVYRSRNRRPAAGTTSPPDGPSFARFNAALRQRPPVVAAALDDVPIEHQVLPIRSDGPGWRWRVAYLLLGTVALGVVITGWSGLWPSSGAKELPSFQGSVEDGHPNAVAPEARLDPPFSTQARTPKASLHPQASLAVADHP